MSGARLRPARVRVARPSRDLAAALAFYVDVLGLEQLGGFAGHVGYDGVFVGPSGADWHVELTRHESGSPAPTPTDEDLIVLYLPSEEVASAAARLALAGHAAQHHHNPYWARAGAVVVRDPDGYLLVLCPEAG